MNFSFVPSARRDVIIFSNKLAPSPKMADETANNAPGVAPSSGDDPSELSPDDLIALIRAVKFAHPEMSIRGVYNEISGTMANSDASYSFLKDVKLNDVKKVWKKALRGSSSEAKNNIDATKMDETSGGTTLKSTDSDPIVPSDGILKFYTVGDGSVKTLAKNYANHYAGAAVAANRQQNADTDELEKYTHFFADIPADMSGNRPHQALINFNDNKKGRKNNSAKNSSKKRESKMQEGNDDGRELFKIQLAALPPGMEDVPTPMLLYNFNRTAKTFIHPPSPSDEDEDDGGYLKIKNMITESGTSGALGATGGQKVSSFVVNDRATNAGRTYVFNLTSDLTIIMQFHLYHPI